MSVRELNNKDAVYSVHNSEPLNAYEQEWARDHPNEKASNKQTPSSQIGKASQQSNPGVGRIDMSKLKIPESEFKKVPKKGEPQSESKEGNIDLYPAVYREAVNEDIVQQ
eukprot:TRINITY_DN7974_c0_g2_i1.p1 TRINITY_DN7974_c0_g2~~TRINITY_DN7974_c0_g2_i1.p1  ORF type:complete len:110 (-),score=24.20 TRINITY_DN7974_c0_g2_i1:12-341(-)